MTAYWIDQQDATLTTIDVNNLLKRLGLGQGIGSEAEATSSSFNNNIKKC